MEDTLIADLETDGFLDVLTKIWTLQIGNADGDDATVYSDHALPGRTFRPLAEGVERIRRAKRVVFHNGLGFDWWVLNRFFPGALPVEKLYDTLPAVRLLDPEERDHRLESWGKRLGVLKGEYSGDFQIFDEELVDYAGQDVVTGRALYRHCLSKLQGWGDSVELEQRTAWAIALQEKNGFLLDVKGAEALAAELSGEVAELESGLQSVFPPIWVPTSKEPFVPKRPNKTMGYTAGAAFTKVELQLFNPSSRLQAADRLMRIGWKPTQFNDGGSPKIDETTLSGLRFKEAKALVKFFQAQKLLGQVSDGKHSWLKYVKPSGRVHGRVNTNGAGTGRMSHSNPNMAQVSKDRRARKLWKPRAGWKLVGCDAEGLEARMLAHYLARWDGGAFGRRVVAGSKEAGTDVHTVNQKALARICAFATRDGAKRLLYALMYGAGDGKLGWTLKDDVRTAGHKPPRIPDRELGGLIRLALAKAMRGLDKLTEKAKAKAKSPGYVIGPDGRHIMCRSQHSALNSLLQGGGAVVMKKALVIFNDEAVPSKGWVHGVDFGYCANVHDEFQVECRPEIAEELGKVAAWCIAEAGLRLNIRCPLAGSFDIGESWAETH